jgi:hypothetical protein
MAIQDKATETEPEVYPMIVMICFFFFESVVFVPHSLDKKFRHLFLLSMMNKESSTDIRRLTMSARQL